MTIKELSRKVQISCQPGAKLPLTKQDNWQLKANGYTCTLTYHSRTMTLDFWQGTGIKGDPTASGVLSCLVSDASSIENTRSFEEWCGELGYDPDSRKSEAIYKKIISQSEALAKLLGPEYHEFMSAETD